MVNAPFSTAFYTALKSFIFLGGGGGNPSNANDRGGGKEREIKRKLFYFTGRPTDRLEKLTKVLLSTSCAFLFDMEK